MNNQLKSQQSLIAAYGEGPDLLDSAITGLSNTDLDHSEAPESWTIRIIIHHLADGDDIWKSFIKQAVGDIGGEFKLDWYWQMPQDEWVAQWNYRERPIAPSLALLRANRAHIVQLLEHSSELLEQYLRICWPKGEAQDVSVGWVVEMQTQHLKEHVGEIRRIRKIYRL